MSAFYNEINLGKGEVDFMKKIFLATAAAVAFTGFSFGQADGVEASTKAKYITEAKAQSLALQKVNGKIVEIDFEHDGRTAYYEMELKTANEEIELEVNAVMGKVTITDREPLKKTQSKKQTLITKEEAIAIAKSKLNGKGKVTDIELESDDSVRYYEIELKHGKKEYDVEVHAVTGKILLFERD